MKCSACEFENPDSMRFCGKCGVALAARCPQCRFDNPPDFGFCGKCGNSLGVRSRARGVGDKTDTQPDTRLSNPDTHPSPLEPRSYTPRHLAEKILNSRSALEGERKTITALFADIKGSMDLLEGLDPEEARSIIDPTLHIMIDAVHRYEGYVAQSTGDGVFALFGAPIANEDHAQRGCYAALRMQEHMRRYAEVLRREKGVSVQVRVGLNTGEVVVRSIRTEDLRAEYTPVGHSTSLAARMESLAAPGSVVVSENTHKFAEGYFHFKALGPTKVKGVTAPVDIYELEGVGPLRTRLELSARRGLTRFVGRREEMEQLRRSWQAAQGGRGQIVAVMGEAGVGKSRLFYEFKVPLQSSHAVLEAYSVSHGKAHAYLPLVELLKDYFRINNEDDDRRRREKATGKLLTLDRTLEDTLPYVFALLGIAEPGSLLERMDPQVRRQRTMEAAKRIFLRETLSQPLVLVFEDLHWIDNETQAFLDLLAESIATAKLLLLVNYRPQYQHSWGSKTFYTQLRLDPLGEEESAELLTTLLGNRTAEGVQPLKQMVLSKTEGNPFFIEEIVQTLTEEGVLQGERGAYRVAKTAEELHVPATVQGVLAGRIDRLPAEEKDLLQTLAVVGKEFPFGLARQVTGKTEEDLQQSLAHLQAAEFVYEQPAFPEPEYTFKHALTHEVAYGSVLVERRKELHECTAQAMEDLYAANLEEHYNELAHHYGRTDNAWKAVEYLHLAGQTALERSAYEEAIDQFKRALEVLSTLPESLEGNQRELLIQTALAPALMATRGWMSSEAEDAYRRARELCEHVGETVQFAAALGGVSGFCLMRGQVSEALALARRMLSVAQNIQDPALPCLPHAYLGETLFWIGDFVAARTHLEQGVAAYTPEKSQYLRSLYWTLDPGVTCLAYGGWVLERLGYPGQAIERSQRALQLAEQLSHPYSQCAALAYDAALQLWLGVPQTAQERAAAAIALADRYAFPDWLMWASLMRAFALAQQGDGIEQAIAQMSQLIEVSKATGAQTGLIGALLWLAETQAKLSRTEEALARIGEASDLIRRTGERQSEAHCQRLRGELLSTRSRNEEAESCFHQAIAAARRQSAKSFELQATMCLARLWQKQGKKAQARDLLSEIYGWFTEGFDTRNLREAKELLGELA